MCGRRRTNHEQRKVSGCMLCMVINVDPNGYELPPSPYRSARRIRGKVVEQGRMRTTSLAGRDSTTRVPRVSL